MRASTHPLITPRMKFQSSPTIRSISAEDWNRLYDGNPFQSYAFLSALETTNCVGPKTGWFPVYFTLEDENQVVGCAAGFIKTHSMGEFVYDFSWGQEASRYGIPYYPKLVFASPFSPVTGQRLHLADEKYREPFVQGIESAARQLGLHSANFLFPTIEEAKSIQAVQPKYALRAAFQYQWKNGNYRCFDDYLQALRSKRRKEVRRERNYVASLGIEVLPILGKDISLEIVADIIRFYRSTSEKYTWGNAYLTDEFFHEIVGTMPENIVFFAAYRVGEIVAGAFCVYSDTTLYGRYWGADVDVPNLHFETCLYAPIEWAIQQGLQVFEPGAGGEHKFSRGFLPQKTVSLHWHFQPAFHALVQRFCAAEEKQVEEYMAELSTQETPFKRED